MLSLGLVFFVALLKTGYSSTAQFSKSNSGISGSVVVDNRWITISLDLSGSWSSLPGGSSCLTDGLDYYIYDSWTYGDFIDRVGSNACSASYTGGHYDPYLACGPYSGNQYCETYSTDYCVESSSAYDSDNVYTCDSTVYDSNPYACEVGDWTGKYGTLSVGSNNLTYLNTGSFWEVTSANVQGKAIVFHCANSGARAFCAPFDTTGDSSETDISQTTTASSVGDNIVGAVVWYPIPMFGEFPVTVVGFLANGTAAGFMLEISSACVNYIYRIYDSWETKNASLIGNNECKAVVGNVWDPTVSCLHGSDSKFCDYPDYHLCNDTSYSYSCNVKDRYSCAPGDLSGKYGVATFENSTFAFFTDDTVLPPLDMIVGKSLVIECDDFSEIIACAEIISFTPEHYQNLTWNYTSPPWNFTIWNFTYPVWNITYPVWNITYPIWNITYPIWNITYPVWNITYPWNETYNESFSTTGGDSKLSAGNFYQISLLVFGVIGLAWLN